MRSPFAIFRKHQKIAMVIVLVLIMVAFTLGDAISRMQGGEMPLILIVGMIAMLGAVLGAMIGVQAGRPSQYAIAGVVIGAVVAFVISGSSGPISKVETNVGSISERELEDLVDRRQIANKFIERLYVRVSPPSDIPMLQTFWQNDLFSKQFTNGLFNPGEPVDNDDAYQRLSQDVILGYLLEHEADEMGIEVTDEAVNDYIHSISESAMAGIRPQKKVTRQDYKEIRDSMGLSDDRLYKILKKELRAQMAFHMMLPRSYASPEEYWRIYKHLNVRQRLDVAAVGIDQFTESVADPEPDQLAAFFEQYSSKYPGSLSPEAPGFFQPRKVQLGYFEADYLDFEKKIEEVTDADIEKYYSDNKEFYRNNPFPEESDADDATNPLDPEFVPEDGPTLTPNNNSSEPAESDEEETSKPKNEASPDNPAENTPKDDSQPADDPEKKGAQLQQPADEGELLALFDPKDETPPPVSDKPAEKTESETSKETSDEAAEKEKSADPKPAVKASDEESKPVAAKKPGDAEPLPEFRPLDEDLQAEIRDDLIRERTMVLMKTAIQVAAAEIYKIREDRISYDEESNESKVVLSDEEIAKRLTQYAEKNDLKYAETGLLSAKELRDSEEHPVGAATDPDDRGAGMGNEIAVWMRTFGPRPDQSRPEQLYNPVVAVSQVTGNRFVAWTIADEEPHAPNLDDPGVEALVLAAWKIKEARPLAEKRAEELAEIVRTSKKGMADALAELTVTGKEEGAQLTTQLTESFSWLRESTAPSTNIFQRPPPEVSKILAIQQPDERADENFMRIVFEQMKAENEVRAVPNLDKSIYYVVQIYDRYPATLEDENALRQSFMRENIFPGQFGSTPYAYQTSRQQAGIRSNWVDRLAAKYGVTPWKQVGRPER